MTIIQILGLLAGAVGGVNVFAANFAMVAMGQFGEPLTECRVESFEYRGTGAKHLKDYKDRFRGLAASDVPDGEYRVDISCRGARAFGEVKVSNLDRFEVVSEYRRLTRSDPPPHLAVRMDSPHPQGETWWLTLRALYRKRNDTVEFHRETGDAYITDPDPGSYLVSVLSSTGYNCLREIDLVERTRLWTFDPAACALHVDAFAHVVADEDKRALKTTSWYQQLRKSEEEFWRALDRLASGASDSDSRR